MPAYYARGRSILESRPLSPPTRVARVEKGIPDGPALADLLSTAPEARELITRVAASLQHGTRFELGQSLAALETFARSHHWI